MLGSSGRTLSEACGCGDSSSLIQSRERPADDGRPKMLVTLVSSRDSESPRGGPVGCPHVHGGSMTPPLGVFASHATIMKNLSTHTQSHFLCLKERVLDELLAPWAMASPEGHQEARRDVTKAEGPVPHFICRSPCSVCVPGEASEQVHVRWAPLIFKAFRPLWSIPVALWGP